MTTNHKNLLGISSIVVWGGLMLFSASASANPYLTAGVGYSNVGAYAETIGVGVKVTDWLRLEADHRTFSSTSETGAPFQVGPMMSDGNTPANYFCNPCHNESVVEDVKVSGNVLSALFTTPEPRAFAYLRVGIMLRTDEITIHPVNIYNTANATTTVADTTYTNAGPQTTSITSTEKIIGIGVSGHGFYAEITAYSSYPGIYISHDFYSSMIGYRYDF